MPFILQACTHLSFLLEAMPNPSHSPCILLHSVLVQATECWSQPTKFISLPTNGLLPQIEMHWRNKEGGGRGISSSLPTYPHKSTERENASAIYWGFRDQRKKRWHLHHHYPHPTPEGGTQCDSAPGCSLQLQAGSWDRVLIGLWPQLPLAHLHLRPPHQKPGLPAHGPMSCLCLS